MPERAEIIQNRIYGGLGRAAQVLGMPVDVYRPEDPLEPLRLLDLMGRTKAVFDARPSVNFAIPAQHNDALRYAIIDGNVVQTGDYLIGAETHFVAGMPALAAIVCVVCNCAVSLRRHVKTLGFGAIDDRAPEVVEESVVFKDWPASMLYAGRASTGDEIRLPGDTTPASWSVLMPRVPDIDLPQAGDVLADDLDRRFVVAWVESAHLGFRMIATQLVAD